MQHSNYESYVYIGMVSPTDSSRVDNALEAVGIPAIVEGSVEYGIRVPASMASAALNVLRIDREKHKYKCVLVDDRQPHNK